MFHDNQDEILSAIMENSAAPSIIARAQNSLETERRRREQFYADIDDDMKIEFINGEIIAHSPVKKEHTEATGLLYKIVDTFVRIAKLGFVGIEKVMSSFTRNDYEPDVVFFGKEKSTNFKKGMWKYPPPDFAVEVVSEGTEDRDRGVKFNDYAAHGVAEYWIVDPIEETVEQYFLQPDGRYKLHLKAGRGLIESRVIAGFSIEIRAIFDEKANLEALRKIMG